MEVLLCTPVSLPPAIMQAAADTAIGINPTNAPGRAPEGRAGLSPDHLALLTSKWWGNSGVHLTVSFMETINASLRDRILSHMNAWSQYGNVKFNWTQHGGQVRISRGPGGYYSYLGTDILHISPNECTMNLEAFTMQTPESEFIRVVRHETGHTLGFPHEHMRGELVARVDPQKAIEYFGRTQGWDEQTVRAQVLTPLEEGQLTATPRADQDSVMCYQLPGEITVDGQPITGGVDIDSYDAELVARVYPGAVAPPQPPPPPPSPGGKTIPAPHRMYLADAAGVTVARYDLTES